MFSGKFSEKEIKLFFIDDKLGVIPHERDEANITKLLASDQIDKVEKIYKIPQSIKTFLKNKMSSEVLSIKDLKAKYGNNLHAFNKVTKFLNFGGIAHDILVFNNKEYNKIIYKENSNEI